MGTVISKTANMHTNAKSANTVNTALKPVGFRERNPVAYGTLKTVNQDSSLPIPIQVDKLAPYLEGYDEIKKRYLLRRLREGFSMGCIGSIYRKESII